MDNAYTEPKPRPASHKPWRRPSANPPSVGEREGVELKPVRP